jgi:hypothetical protein
MTRPSLISPVEGQLMDNGCLDRSDSIDWSFDWSDLSGATAYHLYVKHPDAPLPVIDENNISSSFYNYQAAQSYISNLFRLGRIWRVRAFVNGSWGEWSIERTFDVEYLDTDCVANPDITPPTVPSGLTAETVSPFQIDLSWSESDDNVGVSTYRVYRDGAYLKTTVFPLTSDENLTSGVQYCYTVSAVDAVGNESDQSAQVCATTPSP